MWSQIMNSKLDYEFKINNKKKKTIKQENKGTAKKL